LQNSPVTLNLEDKFTAHTGWLWCRQAISQERLSASTNSGRS